MTAVAAATIVNMRNAASRCIRISPYAGVYRRRFKPVTTKAPQACEKRHEWTMNPVAPPARPQNRWRRAATPIVSLAGRSCESCGPYNTSVGRAVILAIAIGCLGVSTLASDVIHIIALAGSTRQGDVVVLTAATSQPVDEMRAR